MLLLLFSLQDEIFAMSGREVVEVVPLLPFRPKAGTFPQARGVIQLRGRQVPVIDLGLLLTGTACVEAMSSRIIIISVKVDAHQERLLGLLAEKVTETVTTPPDWVPPPPTSQPRRIDGALFAPDTTITWFDRTLLPPPKSLAVLFREVFWR